MSLSDKIKQRTSTALDQKKADERIRRDMINSTSTLMTKFMERVNAGSVEIKDIRDLKDVASIYKEFTGIQEMLDNANAGAPQISLQINNVLNKGLGTKDTIDTEAVDVSDVLENLSAEDVAKMVSDRDKAKNEENEKQW